MNLACCTKKGVLWICATFVLFYGFLSLTTETNIKYIYTLLDKCFRDCEFAHQNTSQVTLYNLPANFNESTCSRHATQRGKGQRVLAFSFYGSLVETRSYFEGIDYNAKLIREFYPGWLMRVYHDIRDVHDLRILCRLQCEYSDILDACFAGDIPGYGNLLVSQPNAWRFLTLSDPFVDVMLSRDLDSFITDREVAAVSEWLQSNLSLHIMRDHPVGHRTYMLAGMWGARLSSDRDLWRHTSEQMLGAGRNRKGHGGDQTLLSMYVWPLTGKPDFAMQHDSYLCERYGGGVKRGYPTQRNLTAPHNFIGGRNHIDGPLVAECPVACRRNVNWTYC